METDDNSDVNRVNSTVPTEDPNNDDDDYPEFIILDPADDQAKSPEPDSFSGYYRNALSYIDKSDAMCDDN